MRLPRRQGLHLTTQETRGSKLYLMTWKAHNPPAHNPPVLIQGRSLPHFKRGEKTPAAKGRDVQPGALVIGPDKG